MRRNAIMATILVLLMSAGIGYMVGGGPHEGGRTTTNRPVSTPHATPATPVSTPGDLPPFFRIEDGPPV